jgi:hypothetical protein
MFRSGLIEHGVDDARLHHCCFIIRVQRQDPIHPLEGQDDAVFGGMGAA